MLNSHKAPHAGNSYRYIFLGASGRIGRLLRAVWSLGDARNLQVDWQFRHEMPELKNTLTWPDFSVLDPLLRHTDLFGDIDGFFVFLGDAQKASQTNESALTAHVTLVEQALNAAASIDVRRVIVASSSAVYGAGHGVPFHESDVLEPVNAYGVAKCEMEKVCRARANTLGIDLCFLRIGNVAGADALLGSAALWQQGDAPVVLDIFPDGQGPRRSYIGPQSLAFVLSGLAQQSGLLADVINVAAPQSVSMNALLDAAGIDWQARYVAASPLQDIALNCSLLEELVLVTNADSAPSNIIGQWRIALGAR
ncbi:NAD-dependent epimerase/dehydratase family protein [Pacificibacter marinus]|uniref:UDP-glucose 4-epimerase n=1 Tax=Pacificibacter marinus TaxID=658057 RepID=A0A1Y5S2F1_9RHOB|nr:NAD-dependent epimerase/dehydratase family protein [Pacificibacter marinus]SEK92660.1 Nucleoside-diphosphate-sugar epimerase [Pacificibacter marinus]SLN31108.1 UDP-glucose 4-epimerase [Pacificibacter marinus]